MRRVIGAACGIAVAGLSLSAAGPQTRRATPSTAPKMATSHASSALSTESQTALVAQYCAVCHSEKGKAGGLSLADFDAARIDEHPDVAEKMIRKLRVGMMPPPKAKRPDAATIAAFV